MAAQRGWWVGVVIDGDGSSQLAVLGTAWRFSVEEIFQEVVEFACCQDPLAIRILSAVMEDSIRSVA